MSYYGHTFFFEKEIAVKKWTSFRAFVTIIPMEDKIEKTTKKPQRLGEAYWLLGMVFVSLGVAICSKADLGVSMIAAPPFILQEVVSRYWPACTVGTMEYIFQGLLLIVLCIAVQRAEIKYLFSFLVAFLYGLLLDLWLLIFGRTPFDAIWLRWVMLLVGDCITAFGVACFFRTYLPLQVYELFVAEVADRYRFPVAKTKLVYDLSSLALSVILAFCINLDADAFDWSKIYATSYHFIGAGTVVTALINAPIIALFSKLLNRLTGEDPLFPKVKEFFKK